MLLKPHILTPTNGGEISIIEYLRRFRDWGWEVDVILLSDARIRSQLESHYESWGIEKTPKGYRLAGLECEVHFQEQMDPHDLRFRDPIEKFFGSLLAERKPDFAFAHYTDFFATSSLMNWDPDRSFIFQTDNEFPRLDQLKPFGDLHQGYSKIKNFLVASSFMQKKVIEAFSGAQTFLLFNVLGLLDESAEMAFDKERYWTFVNPVPVKGFDFFVELARALPEEKFQVIENWGQKADLPSDLRNVRLRESHRDIRSILKSAKGLLMPSQWEEAFGRVPLEAMHFGIPVISSDRGALPDTVGQGGLALCLNLEVWVQAIKTIDSKREDFSQLAKDRVREYRSHRDQSLELFRKELEARLP